MSDLQTVSVAFTYLPTYSHTNLPTYLHTYVRTYLYTYRSTYLPTYIHTYLPTYILTYIPTYPHSHLPTYIFTYIPTFPPTYLFPNITTYLQPTYIPTYLPAYLVTNAVHPSLSAFVAGPPAPRSRFAPTIPVAHLRAPNPLPPLRTHQPHAPDARYTTPRFRCSPPTTRFRFFYYNS